MSGPSYDLNDLPRFSAWPARLLGLERWKRHEKTPAEITREFENEKWGPLLKRVRDVKGRVTIGEVDRWVYEGVPDALCSIHDRLELLPAKEAHDQYVNLVESVLQSYLPASALVELGAGYGSVILGLAGRKQFKAVRLVAGEFTASGCELIKHIAQAQGHKVAVGRCDLRRKKIVEFAIPEDAVVFTSYATTCVPRLPADFVQTLCGFHPRAVVHIEPCYEHCDVKTLLGLMRQRYIQLNDYNTNLIRLLHEQQDRGTIRILEERPALFGMNPLLPVSVVAWKPTDE
jgi:hypothetical protein